jgi:predicted RNA-binding Zn-ribbon protein involved in translation (DUF1610 family)
MEEDIKSLYEDFRSDGLSDYAAKAAVMEIVKTYLKTLASKKVGVKRPCPKCGVSSAVFRNSTCLECDRARIRAQAQSRKTK